jgi:uncharacterized protein
MLAAGATLAQELVAVPPLEARVTDLTGTLTADEQAALEEKLRAFEARKGSQLAVLIVPTTQPEAIEQYGIRVVDAWKLGRKDIDDGALLLVAKDDRRLRIEVGYGLEGAMPDAIAKRIVAETITPLFRQGDFFGGINAGIDQMMRVIDGEPLPEPDQRWKGGRGQDNFLGLLPVLLVVVLVGSTVMRSVFGRPLGAALTGGGIGLVAWIVSQAMALAVTAGIVAFLFSLFTGFGRRGWSSSARHAGWGGGWTGGSGGWGRGGGFGGGFGGGGGGFGGGGASGSW